MLPDVIVSLPRDVPLPQYRLFQHVRFYEDTEENEVWTGTVVGWHFITSDYIAANPKAGFYPRWQYAIQYDPGSRLGNAIEPQLFDESDILEIVES